MDKIKQTPIFGINFINLPVIPASGGMVLKMLTPDSPFLPDFSKKFGELYFSQLNSGQIRAWKKHKHQRELFCVPIGLIKIGFYDDRRDSPTTGHSFAMRLGRPNYYSLLEVPAGIWYGFECLSSENALICNLANIPHDPMEIEREPLTTDNIPVKWADL